jgi:DNA polymerase elongation subunit (family B)
VEFVNAFVSRGRLVLLHREENGTIREETRPVEFISFHRKSDVTANALAALRTFHGCTSIKEDGTYWRIGWYDREIRDQACRLVSSSGVPNPFFNVTPFEADVHPVRRHLADNDDVKIQKPRRCYIDLETDSRVPFSRKEEMRILSWAIVDDNGAEISEVLAEDTDKAERQLLISFFAKLQAYDQVLAWNGDEFDFPVLQARCVARGVPIDLRRWLWLDQMILFERANRAASKSGDEKTSFKLEDVAQSILGRGKVNFSGAKTWDAWAIDRGDVKCPGCGDEHAHSPRECMRRYNVQDTTLLRDIEKKLGHIDLLFSICEVVGCFPDTRGQKPSTQVDAFMLRLGRRKNFHLPTVTYGAERSKVKLRGAYRTKPVVKGIITNEHVIDFERQYPTMVTTYNVSPETMLGRKEDPAWDRHIPHCIAPGTGIAFRTDFVGIFPSALFELIELRKVASKKKAECAPGSPEAAEWERKDASYKSVVNSFPGILGQLGSRIFNADLFESVTQSAAWYIKQIEREFPKSGPGRQINVIDTDGGYCLGGTEEDFKQFVARCNADFFPAYAKEHGAPRCDVRIEYEKAYSRIVHVAATRYFGKYLFYKKSRAKTISKPEIKGIEWRRGDTLKPARVLQEKVIRKILGDWECPSCKGKSFGPKEDCPTPNLHDLPSSNPHDYFALLQDAQKYILEGDVPIEEVRLSKGLGKDLRYFEQRKKMNGEDAKQPRHVEIAKVLASRGESVSEGTKINFVVVDVEKDHIIPASDYQGEFDRHYVWETLVFPPTQRLLEAAFPDIDWSEWANTRPRGKAKRQAAREAEGQATLFGPAGSNASGSLPRVRQMTIVEDEKTSSVKAEIKGSRWMTMQGEVLWIELDSRKHDRIVMQDIHDLLLRCPGENEVRLKVETPAGSIEATTPLRVNLTSELARLVRERLESSRHPDQNATPSHDRTADAFYSDFYSAGGS